MLSDLYIYSYPNNSVFRTMICTAMLLLVCVNLFAQRMPDLPPKHLKLFKPDKNTLICHDSAALNTLFEALDTLSKGAKQQLHILHIGDSHIQADLFSGRMRQLFHQEPIWPTSGRGFIFPYQLAKTNNPPGYTVSHTGNWEGCRNVAKDKSCAWGVAGITATTYDTSATFWLQLGYSAAQKYPIKRAKVFFPAADSTSYRIAWAGNKEWLLSDSLHISLGYHEFVFKDSVTQIAFEIKKTEAAQRYFTMQGINLENDRAGIIYSSLGVNGAEAGSFLKSPDLDNHLRVLQPQMVIVSLGTNDAYSRDFDPKQFRLVMGRLIQRIKMAVPNAVVLLTTPGDSYRGHRVNKSNVEAAGVLFGLAEETGAVLWDFYAVMGGMKSIQRWHAYNLAQRDRLHLSNKGYQLQGDLLYTALMQRWKLYKKQYSK